MKSNQVEIILIEDNHFDAELTVRNLKRHHLVNKITHIDDGEIALDFLFADDGKIPSETEQQSKLILLDLKLPKISGIEILRQIRKDPKTKHIPVIVLTSSKEEPVIKECELLGVNAFIVKPVNFEGISKSISNVGLYWILTNQSAADQ